MALGGGVFVTQNKKLPGSYINLISADRASATIADRGVCALPLQMSWGKEGEVFLVEGAEFIRNSKEIFGYEYTDEKLMPMREVFKNAQKVYFYRLNTGVKAFNEFGTAKHGGVRGNDLKIVITKNINDESKFDVKTYLGTEMLESQTVATAAQLVSNAFVDFKSDVELVETAGTPFTNGTDGSAVTSGDWQTALAKLESVAFNTLAVASEDEGVKALAVAYTKRLRDEQGVKFQTVVHKYQADEKGVISVENNEGAELVYWVAGAEAGCAVNKSVTNKLYDGELTINVDYTQTQLENFIDEGKFVMHRVGEDVRVLTDINTKVTVSVEEGEDFKSNQTVRVLDQIANDIATLFNTKYLGIIPNDEQGRISLWNDIVKHHQNLQAIRAIEEFKPEDVQVIRGNTKKDVVVNDTVVPTNAMERLYMTVVVA